MFKAVKDNKIVAIGDKADFPCLNFDNVEEDAQRAVSDYVDVGGRFALKTDAAALKQKAAEVRAKRDLMLKDSDFAVLPDSPVPEGRKEKWIAYRRYLRDVPQQSGKWWTAGVMSFDEWSAGDD